MNFDEKRMKKIVSIVFVITVVILVILPIPMIVLDILIVTNLLFVLGTFVLLFYVKNIIRFHQLPFVLVLSIAYNCLINFVSAGHILIKGEAFDGRLICFISESVVGSGIEGLTLGFSIFIVIYLIMGLVIIKGCTRIIEISFRFTLVGCNG